MSFAETEVEQGTRSDYIKGLTSLTPTEAYHNLRRATVELVLKAQGGDVTAAQQLVEDYLLWMDEKLAHKEEVQNRSDLEEADIFQIGCLAVLEAIDKLKAEDRDDIEIGNKLNWHVNYEANDLLSKSRLVRNSNSDRSFDHSAREGADLIPEEELEALVNDTSTDVPSPENEIYKRPEFLREVLDFYLGLMTPRVREYMLQNFFSGRTLEDISHEFNITKQAVSQAMIKGFKEMATLDTGSQHATLHSLLQEDQTNRGLEL